MAGAGPGRGACGSIGPAGPHGPRGEVRLLGALAAERVSGGQVVRGTVTGLVLRVPTGSGGRN